MQFELRKRSKERLAGAGQCLLFYCWSWGLDGGGACGKQRTSCAGGVAKQKPGVAASSPFWEVGLVPRDEGASGEVEKTSLPRADMTSGLEAQYRGRRTNVLSCHEAGSYGGYQVG